MNKKISFLAVILFMSLGSYALDLGVIAGSISRPSSFCFGLSIGSGTVLPLLKFEFEGYRIRESARNSLSAAVKLKPKFGRFSPYVLLGAGGEFEKLNFRFSEYAFHTFIGGGLNILFESLFSLRFDLRFLHYSDINRTRISGGIFIHL
jgi:hypothetical protein